MLLIIFNSYLNVKNDCGCGIIDGNCILDFSTDMNSEPSNVITLIILGHLKNNTIVSAGSGSLLDFDYIDSNSITLVRGAIND